ncbi:MAG: ribonuclease III [Flavobacteriales bacterium]|jgi:ribonuclease-3|nr:ribonuclease III [Flavobacteriales bacterium]
MIRFWQRLTRATQTGPDTDIRTLVRREFGLRVRQRSAYDEALTHSSMLDGDKTGLKSNERLEFLGDVVLDLTMANYLYRSFPTEQEGELTKRKSRIVNRKNLNLLGKNMGLHHLIQAKMRREDIHDSMIGNGLEALIGAIYLDHGFERTQRAVLLMLKHYGLDEQVNETHDFKSQLHQWATKRRKSLLFDVMRDDDSAGEERYEIAAKVNGEVYGIGVGRSKKLAEQEAARRAWKKVYDRRTGADSGSKPTTDDESKSNRRGEGRRSRGSGPSRRRRDSGSSKAASKDKDSTTNKGAKPSSEASSEAKPPTSRSRRSGRGRGGRGGGSGSKAAEGGSSTGKSGSESTS